VAERPAVFDDNFIPVTANPLVIPLAFPDDDFSEAAESMRVTFIANGMAALPDQRVNIVVADDDALSVTVAAPEPATASEGGVAEFTVSITGRRPGAPLPVPTT